MHWHACCCRRNCTTKTFFSLPLSSSGLAPMTTRDVLRSLTATDFRQLEAGGVVRRDRTKDVKCTRRARVQNAQIRAGIRLGTSRSRPSQHDDCDKKHRSPDRSPDLSYIFLLFRSNIQMCRAPVTNCRSESARTFCALQPQLLCVCHGR